MMPVDRRHRMGESVLPLVRTMAALLEQREGEAGCQYRQPDQREPKVQGAAVHCSTNVPP
jgi:hypothetical protein